MPKLLTLQHPESDDELPLIVSVQWFELWFKVLKTDLQRLSSDSLEPSESAILIRRGIELFKLFDLQLSFAESTLVRDLAFVKTLRLSRRLAFSRQLTFVLDTSRRLTIADQANPELHVLWHDYSARLESFRTRFARLSKAVFRSGTHGGLSYDEWLCLSELLNLQQGAKADWSAEGTPPGALALSATISPHENMFIIVHQCFEIWFKFILAWIDRAVPLMLEGRAKQAARFLHHIDEIQRILTEQIHIPATMLPLDFSQFRFERRERDGIVEHRGLSPASGTESYQFREIEIVSSLRDDAVFRKYLGGTDKLPTRLLTPRQTERMQEPTLLEAFETALSRHGVHRIDDIFKLSNQPNPFADLATLADTLLDFDEAFHLWRVAHVNMVKKMIGSKSGTGFLGPEYLMETAGFQIQQENRILPDVQTRPRFFEELWRVRTRLGS